MSAPADQLRLIKRLRIALVLVAMLVGVAVIAVIGVLFYWNSYLLGSRGDDPFTRGLAAIDPAFVATTGDNSYMLRT